MLNFDNMRIVDTITREFSNELFYVLEDKHGNLFDVSETEVVNFCFWQDAEFYGIEYAKELWKDDMHLIAA